MSSGCNEIGYGEGVSAEDVGFGGVRNEENWGV